MISILTKIWYTVNSRNEKRGPEKKNTLMSNLEVNNNSVILENSQLKSSPTKKGKETADEIHNKLLALVRKEKDLYGKILRYEPLDFNEVYNSVISKDVNLKKCSKKILKDFFDSQGISYIFPEAGKRTFNL